MSLADMHAATFKAQLQTLFAVRHQPPTSLVLADVAEPDAPPSGMELFALYFRGPATEFIGQGTHPLAHPELGDFDLFLVPVGRDGDEIVYEAAFHRLIRRGQ